MPPEPTIVKLKSVKEKRSTPAGSARSLALLLVVVFLAGALPICATPSCCFSTPAAASVHSQMPCCDEQPSVVSSDAMAPQAPTMNGSLNPPHQWVSVVMVSTPDNSSILRVFATQSAERLALSEDQPPHFLLNAQFLI